MMSCILSAAASRDLLLPQLLGVLMLGIRYLRWCGSATEAQSAAHYDEPCGERPNRPTQPRDHHRASGSS